MKMSINAKTDDERAKTELGEASTRELVPMAGYWTLKTWRKTGLNLKH